MKDNGNVHVNEILNPDGVAMPSGDDYEAESYIRKKYQQRAFAKST